MKILVAFFLVIFLLGYKRKNYKDKNATGEVKKYRTSKRNINETLNKELKIEKFKHSL